MSNAKLTIALAALLLVAGLVSGCGDGAREERLAAASKAVATARSEVDEAQAAVDAKQAAADEAQSELANARERLKAAESRLADAKSEMAGLSTDDLLFRAVQKRLLEDDELEKVAIAAKVDAGVVTLSGSVPEEDIRKHALEVARETPGVVSVVDQISIPGSDVSAEE